MNPREPIHPNMDDATDFELRAARAAVAAFGKSTTRLNTAEFAHAARFAAARFEELAEQYEREAAV